MESHIVLYIRYPTPLDNLQQCNRSFLPRHIQVSRMSSALPTCAFYVCDKLISGLVWLGEVEVVSAN
jgi:hypothetical protein